MDTALSTRITRHLDTVGYAAVAIADGIAYADKVGFEDAQEALSLVVSHMLYEEEELEAGLRVPVSDTDW